MIFVTLELTCCYNFYFLTVSSFVAAHDEMNNSSDNDDELASSFNNSVKLDSASTPPFGTTGGITYA